MTDGTQTQPSVLAVSEDQARRRFEIKVDGQLAAFVTYRIDPPGTYAFTHTETRPGFNGQGLATALIEDVLNRMRAGGYAVLPYCPFVNSYLRRHSEFADLVPESDRRRFGVGE